MAEGYTCMTGLARAWAGRSGGQAVITTNLRSFRHSVVLSKCTGESIAITVRTWANLDCQAPVRVIFFDISWREGYDRRVNEDSEVGSSPGAEIVGEALGAVGRFDAEELQAVLHRGVTVLGGPVFLDDVVAPAVRAVGEGWCRGVLSVAQEHMSTAVFRRVLEWQLGVYRVDRDHMPRLVVATPPGDAHELGALMVAVSAVGEGWGITYLGPDLPVGELLAAAGRVEARAVALSTVYSPNDEKLLAAVKATREGLPKSMPLMIGGAAAHRLRRAIQASGAIVLDSLPELRATLRELRRPE